jgi:apolipoprotein D and lipocalin family protein
MRFLLLASIILAGCTGTPKGVTPVADFDLQRYLGRWYEIARLDHSFERGLESVIAEYEMREDGGINVINRGRHTETGVTEQAQGRAYFVGDSSLGHLKVSFFGPFYGSYIVFELDQKNYHYAFVTSYNTNYLWLLSRTPKVSDELIKHFTSRSAELGFDTSKLIFVSQK